MAEGELVAIIIQAIREATGLKDALVEPIAQSIDVAIRKKAGGTYLYVPVPMRNRKKRNEAIRKEWRGDNHKQIMSRYEISRATLYRILGEKRSKSEPKAKTDREPDTDTPAPLRPTTKPTSLRP